MINLANLKLKEVFIHNAGCYHFGDRWGDHGQLLEAFLGASHFRLFSRQDDVSWSRLLIVNWLVISNGV